MLAMMLLLMATTGRISSARIPTASGIAALVTTRLLRQRRRRSDLATLQVDIDPSFVLLSSIVEAHLTAYLLNAGLDLLHMANTVVSPADDDVQMRLAPRLSIPEPRLEDVLCLLDELPMQIDSIVSNTADGVVLPEDVLRGLLVVGVLRGGVFLAFV